MSLNGTTSRLTSSKNGPIINFLIGFTFLKRGKKRCKTLIYRYKDNRIFKTVQIESRCFNLHGFISFRYLTVNVKLGIQPNPQFL
jgi:hypothetical protein